MIKPNDRILILGHRGMVGSAIINYLTNSNKNYLIYNSDKYDLRHQESVKQLMFEKDPNYVILAAAKVGGIGANLENQAKFLYDNLMIQSNVINECIKLKNLKRFVFLGSSCIYPRNCPQPMKESYLMSGPLEPTNEGYALAKIAGLKLAEFYSDIDKLNVLSLMPCNLYGPGDNFDPKKSHVMAALVKKFVDAKIKNKPEVVVWGDGTARREFMHVKDFVRCMIHLLEYYPFNDFINIGTGTDITIKLLAELIKAATGYTGNIVWDKSKPNGMPQKLLDISNLNQFRFKPKIELGTGIKEMIKIYKELL